MLARWVPQNGGIGRTSSSPVPTVDSLFDEAFTIFRQPFLGDRALGQSWAPTFAPPADVVETDSDLRVSVDLPGHDPRSLEVKLEGATLTIQAERRQTVDDKGFTYLRSERGYGLFSRSFELPAWVDASTCRADYQHGVLSVTMPKKAEARPRTIEVKVHS